MRSDTFGVAQRSLAAAAPLIALGLFVSCVCHATEFLAVCLPFGRVRGGLAVTFDQHNLIIERWLLTAVCLSSVCQLSRCATLSWGRDRWARVVSCSDSLVK